MPDESTSPVMPPVISDDASQTGSDNGVSDTGSASDVSSGGSGGVTTPVDNNVDSLDTVASDEVPPVVSVDDQLASSSAVVTPMTPDAETVQQQVPDMDIPAEVARKIGESHNVLIAISSDPSVDELAAAIGLSIYLDRMGKRATAIYSGTTPNALEFLKPEETFEPTADTLQDFVIALNKEKADHLRYKLDGDYVKIYITPYRHRLSEEDLEYSYGDYNVDLVLALDVANGIDLDDALREHGRIMHDAVIINITTGNPGKFGEIEWSDKKSSSVSEMIAGLLYSMDTKVNLEKEEATAFLTGIVAATNRFSSSGTTPATMRMASRLMESGANQQLISKNITPDVDNEMFAMGAVDFGLGNGDKLEPGAEKKDTDPTKLDIEHGNEVGVDETKEVSDTITEKESTLLDDLKAAEASLAGASADTVPETGSEPVKIEEDKRESLSDAGATIGGGTSLDVGTTVGSDTAIGGGVSIGGDTAIGDDTSTSSGVSLGGGTSLSSDTSTDSDTSIGGETSVGSDTSLSSEPSSIGDTSGTAQEESDNKDTALGGVTVKPSSDLASEIGKTDDSVSSSDVGSLIGQSDSSSSASSETNENGGINSEQPEVTLAPSSDFSLDSTEGGTDKYSKMLEDALADVNNAGENVATNASTTVGQSDGASDNSNASMFNTSTPSVGDNTIGTSLDTDKPSGNLFDDASQATSLDGGNPAMASAPAVPSNPEINGVPSINYMPMPGDEVLPPPPTPPIDMSMPPLETPSASEASSSVGVGATLPGVSSESTESSSTASIGSGTLAAPAAPATEPAALGQTADPGAFKIPGM